MQSSESRLSSFYDQAENTQDEKKNFRGRKPVKDKAYIEERTRTIKEYEKQLEDHTEGIKKMSEEAFKKLYIKCSALKTRVKKRREQMFMNQDKEQFGKQFKLLCEIITNHLDGEARNDVMDALT